MCWYCTVSAFRIVASFHIENFPCFLYSSGIEEKRVPCKHFKIHIRYSSVIIVVNTVRQFWKFYLKFDSKTNRNALEMH